MNFVRVARDITKELQLEEQLRQRQKLEALGALAAGVAHEISNPLNVILMTVQLLQIEGTDPELRKDYHGITTQVSRIEKIVQAIRSFARKQESKFAAVHLSEVIEEAIELVKADFRYLKIRIFVTINENLPPVLADKDQLLQVLVNVLTNARHAMPSGGTLRIGASAGCDTERPNVNLTVSDTGTGISPDHQARIFDPFFTTKDSDKGTGLGLSVCHGIIKEHNGSIAVESSIDAGTTFTISLPVFPIENVD